MDYAGMFRQRANDFRRTLADTIYTENLGRFVGDIRTQCVLLLFEAIDANLLHEYWKPGERPETIPRRDANGNVRQKPGPPMPTREREILVKATEAHYAKMDRQPTAEEKQYLENLKAGRTMIRVGKPDKDLNRDELARLWWIALIRLYFEKRSAFPENAALDDLKNGSDLLPASESGFSMSDPQDAADKLRRRASSYACACDLISSTIEAKAREPNGSGDPSQVNPPGNPKTVEPPEKDEARQEVRTGKAGARRKYDWTETITLFENYLEWRRGNPGVKQAVFDDKYELGVDGIKKALNRIREICARFKKSKQTKEIFENENGLTAGTVARLLQLKMKKRVRSSSVGIHA